MDMARTRPWVVPVVLLASVLLCTHHVAGVVLEPESEKVANTNSTNSTPVPLIWIIPHSHDDTGWQRTVDQYHVEDVRNILTETVKALKANRNRTFVEVEIAFFKRWWMEQDEETKQDVRTLVSNGQLEFINGGWCMADEAVTHFEGVVNQLTVGHNFLQREVGVTPRFGWSIDPFGASATFAAMFADMGYDGFVIDRIHYLLKDAWKQTKSLEFTWRGTPSRGTSADMFTHVLDSHYSAPWGFDWEYYTPGACNTFDLATQNPALHAEPLSLVTPPNLAARAQVFAQEMQQRAAWFRTPNVLVPFGDDFKFQNPHVQYENMDLLIEHVNANVETYGIRMKYATLGQYMDAVRATDTKWPVYTGDFFPYAFAPDGVHQGEPGWASANSYWAGFYTSRPQLKGWARSYDGLLHATEVAVAVASSTGSAVAGEKSQTSLQTMREVSGVLKHHDAETGTSVPYVVNDFMTRALSGSVIGSNLTATMVQSIARHFSKSRAKPEVSDSARLGSDPEALSVVCDGGVVPVVLFNSLARLRREMIHIGLDCNNVAVTMLSSDGQSHVAVNLNHTLPVDYIAPSPLAAEAPPPYPPPVTHKYDLYALVDIPPVGYTTIFVSGNASATTMGMATQGKVSYPTPGQLTTITNGVVTLEFNNKTGELAAVSNNGTRVAVKQEMMNYDSCTMWPDSTAYVFRPSFAEQAFPVLRNTTRSAPSLVSISGPLVQQVYQTYNPAVNASVFLQQSLRLYSDPEPNSKSDVDIRTYIDSMMVVGMKQTMKELVTRFTTDLDNVVAAPAGADDDDDLDERFTFYTDANGLGIKRREFHHPFWDTYTPGAVWDEPVAVNYYPAATASYIRDENGTRSMQFTVVTDRAHGVATQGYGQLEVMMHRRNSPTGTISLDDTSIIHAHQAFSLAKWPSAASAAHRALSRRMIHKVQFLYGVAPTTSPSFVAPKWATEFEPTMSFVSAPLPANVALQSVDVVLGNPSALVLRLRHMFAADENPVLSQPVTVNLLDIFAPSLFHVTNTQAVTLNTNTPTQEPFEDPLGLGFQTTVSLHPLETKTFIVSVAPGPAPQRVRPVLFHQRQ